MYGDLPRIKIANNDTSVAGYPLQILNPPKTAVLRLATNAELIAYLAAQYSIVRAQGGSEDVPTPKAEKILFESIRLDKGEEFDEAEISYAIGIMTQHRVGGCEREGQTFVVSLQSRFDDTTHVVNIPTQKQMADYRKNLIKSRRTGRGVEEWRYPISVPSDLHDALVVSTDGYAGEVPVHHKRTVIDSIMNAMAELDPNIDPNS